MKPAALFASSLIVAAASGALAGLAVRSSSPEQDGARAAAPSSAEDLALLLRRQSELESRLVALETRTLVVGNSERLDVGAVGAAVDEYLARREGVAGAISSAVPASASVAGSTRTIDMLLDELLVADWDRGQELWKEAGELGLVDDLVARFEASAEANPDDPEAHVGLGQAYLQKTFLAGGGPEAGKWAIKADEAFDTALGLDDHNWSARFIKATSLSFWPAVFGKQNEAIHHFEILVGQQGQGASEPHHAETHLWLGNLYQQIGQSEKAVAAWKGGLALFPDNAAMQKQIELTQAQ